MHLACVLIKAGLGRLMRPKVKELLNGEAKGQPCS